MPSGLAKGAQRKSVGGKARIGIKSGRARGSDTARRVRSNTPGDMPVALRSSGRASSPSFTNWFAR